MLWKAGCLVTVLGLLVSFSSCALFGRAVQTATDVHDVANLPLDPGGETVHSAVLVDPDRGVQIRIEATILLADDVLEGVVERASIVQVSAPVNFTVEDDSGERLHSGAGNLGGSTIVPEASSTHRDSFDPKVSASYSSATFSAATTDRKSSRKREGDRALTVRVDLPTVDDDENPIVSARVFVVERPLSGAGSWTLGGFASAIFGPFVAFLGVVLFAVGMFTRRKAPKLPPVPGGPS